jgi:hypothetical protein
MISLRSLLSRRVVRILDHSRKISTRAGRRVVAASLLAGLAGTLLAGLLGIGGIKKEAKAETPPKIEEKKPDSKKAKPADVPITGRIVDVEGRPVPGVAVRFAEVTRARRDDLTPWLESVRRGEAPWMVRRHLKQDKAKPSGKTETDAQGRFRLEGLGAEKVVTLSIESPTVAYTQLKVVTRQIEPFPARGFTNPYGPGIQTIYGADFTLTATPGRIVEGVIRDAKDGKVMQDIDVWSYGFAGTDISGGLGNLKARTDGEGRFRLGGFPMGSGNTLLIVPNDDQPYLMREVAIPDLKGPEAIPVEIDLHRGIWIEGKVTDQETGAPVAGACLRYLPLLSNKFAQSAHEFHPSGYVDGSFYEQRYRSKSNGTFRLVGLPGRAIVGAVVYSGKPYRRGTGAESIKGVGAMGPEFATYANPLRASRYFPHSMKEIDPSEGAETVHLDLVLDPGAKVRLRVVDPRGEPVTGVTTAGRRERGEYDDEAQSEAEFEVLTLQPGEHRLVLLVHKSQKLGRVIQVKAGDDKNGPVVVTLDPTATIAGRIVDPDGNPVSSAIIRCKPLPGDNFYIKVPELVSGQDGKFTIPNLPTGCGYMGAVYFVGKFNQRQIAFENATVRPGETTNVGDVKFKKD